jgi:hypothetical protein
MARRPTLLDYFGILQDARGLAVTQGTLRAPSIQGRRRFHGAGRPIVHFVRQSAESATGVKHRPVRWRTRRPNVAPKGALSDFLYSS